MVKFLFNNCRNFPVIGNPIKVAYVGYLVKNLVKKTKQDESKSELKNLASDELENAVNDAAKEMFNTAVGPVLAEYSIPAQLVAPAKNRAINELTKVLKEQAIKKVADKI